MNALKARIEGVKANDEKRAVAIAVPEQRN